MEAISIQFKTDETDKSRSIGHRRFDKIRVRVKFRVGKKNMQLIIPWLHTIERGEMEKTF